MDNKFKKFLNILLVILIAVTIIFLSIWGYSEYTQYMIASDAEKAIEEFDNETSQIVILSEDTQNDEENIDNITEEGQTNENNKSKKTSTTKNKSNSSQTTTTYVRKKYKGFYMAGYIQIPKTKIKLPVLESVSEKALNVSVGILMGPGLNQVGNTTIIGHNLHNRSLFSRNNLIEIGDPIYITDEYGNKLIYYVYDKYITDADDASYMTRDTGGAIEISLSCCTNDNVDRLVIWARAE